MRLAEIEHGILPQWRFSDRKRSIDLTLRIHFIIAAVFLMTFKIPGNQATTKFKSNASKNESTLQTLTFDRSLMMREKHSPLTVIVSPSHAKIQLPKISPSKIVLSNKYSDQSTLVVLNRMNFKRRFSIALSPD